MADDPLDVIAAERTTLSNALAQANNDADKQKILGKLGDLQDLQNQIIFDQFESEAALIAAMTASLQAIITDLQGHINNLFLDQLTNIGTQNDLLPAGTPTPGNGTTGGGSPGGAATGSATTGGTAGGTTGGTAGSAAGAATGGTAGGTSATSAGSGGTGARAAGAGSTSNDRGVDCALDCTKIAAKVSAAGQQFVARYYRGRSQFPTLTAAEAAALCGANLKIVTVWEAASDHIGHFSHSSGVDEGTSAYRQALVVGQPPNTPIYFAVDNDFDSGDIAGPITDYFHGIAEGFATIGKQAPVYAIGVYGSGLVCSTLLAHGLARFSWLAMSTGWRGSKTFNDWNIKQSASTLNLGVDHDADVARPGYGGFRVST
jgi:hypothetical protein